MLVRGGIRNHEGTAYLETAVSTGSCVPACEESSLAVAGGHREELEGENVDGIVRHMQRA